MALNWNNIGKARDYPRPCCCVFVAPAVEMDDSDCPIHRTIRNYTCCGNGPNEPCVHRCTTYRPKRKTPTLRFECLGEPAFATAWAPCVCGHPAQYHG